MTPPRPRCPGGPHSPRLRRPESMIDTMTAQLPATWRPLPLDPTGWLVLDRPVGVEGPWIDEIRTRLRVLDPLPERGESGGHIVIRTTIEPILPAEGPRSRRHRPSAAPRPTRCRDLGPPGRGLLPL